MTPKNKMNIAVIQSQSPYFAAKDFELALALLNRGHNVDMLVCSSKAEELYTQYQGIGVHRTKAKTAAEYAYSAHIWLLARTYSVAIAHSYQSPLYYEATFGGTPLVVIHEDASILDPLDEKTQDRNELWTQHLIQTQTLRIAEKVVVYDKRYVDNYWGLGIRVDFLQEPVRLSTPKLARRGTVIVAETLEEIELIDAVKNLGEEFSPIIKLSVQELGEKYKVFQEVNSALVLCDIPSLAILKYGCNLVRFPSDEPATAYISPEFTAAECVRALAFSDRSAIEELLNSRSYENFIGRGFEKILLDAIPKAIARGRTRGW